MDRDARAIRAGKPIVFTNLKTGDGLDPVIDWIRHDVLFEPRRDRPRRGRSPARAGQTLRFARRGSRTVLAHSRVEAPMAIVRPFALPDGGVLLQILRSGRALRRRQAPSR